MGSKYSTVAATQWYIEGSRYYGKAGYNLAKRTWRDNALSVGLKNKHYIVTGANAGIGKSVAHELAKKHATVHMLCRSKERGELAQKEIIESTMNEDIVLHVCDVSLESDVRSFISEYKKTGFPISGLVNNAGVMMKDRQETAEGNEIAFATMGIQTHLLTNLLVTELDKTASEDAAAGRVINVSSAGMYPWKFDPTDLIGEKGNEYDGMMAYSASKRAQIILTELWAEKMVEQGLNVRVNSMHPGWTKTPGIERSMPEFAESKEATLRNTEEGADTIVWMLISPEAEEFNGKFFFDRKPTRTHMPFAWTRESDADRKSLWDQCTEMFHVDV